MAALLPRCNCEEGEGIQRAAVEMTLTFVETDSCSDAELVRRIPDDFLTAGRTPVTDFGSRATKKFEIRSTGTAPLKVSAIELSAEDAEFTMRILGPDQTTEATLPLQIPADLNANSPPGAIVEVSYAATDAEPDLVDLVVRSDDPEREEVKFGLAAGRGKLTVCVGDQCENPSVQFGNVSIGELGTQTVVIKNTGEGDLELHGIKLASDSPEFCAPEATEIPAGVQDCSLINLCRVLKPGEEYTLNVKYSPANGGVDTGVITIVSGDASRGNVEVPINATGAGPAICACLVDGADCTPSPLVDFGSADVGASVERTIRLTSCGTDAVEITEAVLETMAGPYQTGPEFTIATAFPTGTFQPNEFSEGVISYRPGAGGEHRGGLRYVISQNSTKSWIALVGRAATCELSVLPASLSFGTVGSSASSDRVVTLSNNGVRDCTVSAITDPTNGFTLVNRPQLPYTVASGQFYDLTVRYTAPERPMAVLDTSSFIVTANEPSPNEDNPVMLSASGGGMAFCAVQVQPSGNSPLSMRDGLLQFNAVNIGYSKTLSIRVTNTGTTDCTLQSFALTTQATNQIVVTPTAPMPASFTPGNSVELEVTFTPTGPGPMIAIPPGTYGSLQNHIDFVLAGSGLMQTAWSIGIRATPTIPTIDVLPDNLDFGVVTWQNPGANDRSQCGSQERQVNIYNSGTGDLDIMFIQVDATSDPFFDIVGVTNGGNPVSAPYAFRISPGGSATALLRFFPTRINPGPHHGLLLIENSVTGSGVPLTVPLTGEGTANSAQTDIFQQLADNKIDILWVVDDSGSMSEEQNLLANNFAGFISFADQQGVDYQTGVITTEINDAPAGKLWACNGFNKIIRSTDANRVQAFQCAANVTSPPSGNSRPNPLGSDEAEAGLQAARLALDSPIRDNENVGFLRDDARLAVIIVSDEEDQSPGSTQLYNDFFRNIKGWANPQLVSVSAIAGDVPNGCATAVSGARYLDVVQHLNGQFESVCSQSWNSLLMNIGIGVFTLRTAWTLSRPADQATIVARVGGNPVAQNAANGWTFDAASNTVTFHGSSIPPPGSQIEIQYNAVCLQ
jgi:hypothetical protein